jgi:hypothetical protein
MQKKLVRLSQAPVRLHKEVENCQMWPKGLDCVLLTPAEAALRLSEVAVKLTEEAVRIPKVAMRLSEVAVKIDRRRHANA